jgi:TonB family protein
MVKRVAPIYSSEAMRARIQGAVDVQVVIGTLGTVTRARVVRAAWASERAAPHDRNTMALANNALAAAKAAVFKPGVLGELPVAVLGTITMQFVLHGTH